MTLEAGVCRSANLNFKAGEGEGASKPASGQRLPACQTGVGCWCCACKACGPWTWSVSWAVCCS